MLDKSLLLSAAATAAFCMVGAISSAQAQNLSAIPKALKWTGCCSSCTYKNGGWTCSGCSSQVGGKCKPNTLKSACHTTNDQTLCIPVKKRKKLGLKLK